ncbi:MAG: hypothetical protein ACYTFA_12645 [Planctomycetota bacterium]
MCLHSCTVSEWQEINGRRQRNYQLFDPLDFLAELIQHIYQADQLLCPQCGGTMKMLAEWCEVARQDGDPDLVKFAEMLKRHHHVGCVRDAPYVGDGWPCCSVYSAFKNGQQAKA